MGPYQGGQAVSPPERITRGGFCLSAPLQEYVRVPFADFNALKLPPGNEHEDDFALLADIFPTVCAFLHFKKICVIIVRYVQGWHGVELSVCDTAKLTPRPSVMTREIIRVSVLENQLPFTVQALWVLWRPTVPSYEVLLKYTSLTVSPNVSTKYVCSCAHLRGNGPSSCFRQKASVVSLSTCQLVTQLNRSKLFGMEEKLTAALMVIVSIYRFQKRKSQGFY